MVNLRLVLLLLALILFVIAGAGVSAPRVNLVAIGLALWVLALIVA